ncbi:MAG: hypothetical protein JNL33_02905 [Betaproteobacteria bacterium]|nr:hypothetical protein [Betaproteobacteria bacterium]
MAASSKSTTGAKLRNMRHAAERKKANRGSANYFRPAEASDADTAASRPRDAAPESGSDMSNDAVTQAVLRGYKVAGEQMRKAAAGFRSATAAAGRGDAGEALNQSVRAAGTMSGMLQQLVESLLASSQLWTQWMGGQGADSGVRAAANGLRSSLSSLNEALNSGNADGSAGGQLQTLLRQATDQFIAFLKMLGEVASQTAGGATGRGGRIFIASEVHAGWGTLTVWGRTDATELRCDGLLGKGARGRPVLLETTIAPIRSIEGVWETSVQIGSAASPGTYRGVVVAGDVPVGVMEVTLRKRGDTPQPSKAG